MESCFSPPTSLYYSRPSARTLIGGNHTAARFCSR
ncbi:unnamed protein product [Spirodela intermedia]|uniref:Uncharacterized protein n=1 Tax=Spirodela intermedia TaxID=51605 RepID=A0A7I8L884_SPIIN|nr:unnamed protein product [Spirodela intermedia]